MQRRLQSDRLACISASLTSTVGPTVSSVDQPAGRLGPRSHLVVSRSMFAPFLPVGRRRARNAKVHRRRTQLVFTWRSFCRQP